MSYKKTVTVTQSHYDERVDSDHKEVIIKQLKNEIAALRSREQDYNAAVEDIKVLRGKVSQLHAERADVEARRDRFRADKDDDIRRLRVELKNVENRGEDMEIEIAGLNKERQLLESDLDQRELEANDIKRDMSEESRINQTMTKKIRDLEKEIGIRENENRDQESRLKDLTRRLDSVVDENRLLEKDISACEGEIGSLKDQLVRVDDDRHASNVDYDKLKQRFADLTKQISSLDNHIYSVERDIKHVRTLNDTFKADIGSTDKGIQSFIKKNSDLNRDIDRLDADIKYDLVTQLQAQVHRRASLRT
jgi:chromosome segregation ATPase